MITSAFCCEGTLTLPVYNQHQPSSPTGQYVQHPSFELTQAPEIKLRDGGADNVDADVCTFNWIHHNTLRTYGNECVDIKEGSEYNLIEHNVCEHQMDSNSGCMGSRGSHNTFRYNEIAECLGACVRVGGDKGYGEGNNIYKNVMKNCENAAFTVMSPNQGVVCDNEISGVSTFSTGSDDQDQYQFSEESSLGECSSTPGDIEGFDSPQTTDDDDEGDGASVLTEGDDLSAGVNYTGDAETSEPEVETIETNESAGSTGLGNCGSVVAISQASVQHPEYADSSTSVENLFDGDDATYFSVHRETTYITLELEQESTVDGVAIGFFMKEAQEERIQTFDILVRTAAAEEWTTAISRKESSGSMDIQTFPFSSRTALYVRLETHGNDFNNWSAFTELEVCAEDSAEESNALFGGMEAMDEELEVLAGEICSAPTKLSAVEVKVSDNHDNVKNLFDGNFESRWSTQNTQNESDMENDKVTLTFGGDTRISSIKISFFNGNLAKQYFSIYRQSASENTWTPVMQKEESAQHELFQEFDINSDRIHKLYIVGNGNEVGDFSKFSEIEVYGC